jgi:RNA polymerase sigma-70 factor (ECF subfamily)
MQHVQKGCVELFDALVERHRTRLLHVAHSKLGDEAWAEDVVQEAFLAAFSARQTYKPEFAFSTWLWTILLNLCRRQQTRRSRRPHELAVQVLPDGSVAHSEPASCDSGLSHALLLERQQQVVELLNELPEAQADALRLRFYGELKFDEIARAMGSSVSAAKVRVRKGLASLAGRIRELEGKSP